MQKFKRVLVANRGEIAIRVFRACRELGIRSVAIYSEEDKNSLFRTLADESYQIGKGKSPIDAYLSIGEIIELAKAKGVDAIHPGYGFLSENSEFAKQCEEAGIAFIGPTHVMMDALGDKIQSKIVANSVGVPTIPGVEKAAENEEEVVEYAKVCGYPLILKASAGGGGRGMRIVRDEKDLLQEYRSAKSEAKKAFGIDTIFVERYIENPKHIEVQVLGDKHGNLVHLFERDCSIQRRHQKVIEFGPALCLNDEQRQAICNDALKIAGSVNYRGAGTVEFLVDASGQHYFIEMNPRIQVEHTVSEMITGIDIVQAQILVAQGYRLDSDEINIKSQDDVKANGFAIQCRITTEDPANNFAPDTGVIDVYRSSSGNGIRLDGGNAFTGSVITPYYDSLLVKIIAHDRTFNGAVNKALRALKETNIKGVKTNIGFIMNVLNHEDFRNGNCDTNFIAKTPELFTANKKGDKELKLLKFLGEKVVNETKGVKPNFDVPQVPKNYAVPADISGTKQILDAEGPEGLVKWVLAQKKLLLTDTTFRDAHQSLMATRVRTRDMSVVAEATSVIEKDAFSLEMWGGATFDVAYNFLKESPWERLDILRAKIPNIMFQMLLRGANAVGYKNYPDNVIRAFVKESADAGIDVFRIFDSLNWLKGMEVAIDETLKQGKVVEACLCYTGDIMDPTRDKYTLDYYVRKAKELERTGTHILGIKDMSGLLKPAAATKLISTLKQEIGIPIHLHTHDTTGNGVATVLAAADAGVDIADCAINAMAGLTSQPAMNSIVAALENTGRETGMSVDDLQKVSDYWAAVRPVYGGFESDLKSTNAEIYKYEIPGGQYSNLKAQVESFGLGHRFDDVKKMYRDVNMMLGDIVKVTPSSKVVGDLTIYMIQNDLTPENIYEKAAKMDFPDSVVTYFEGMMGQPEGGFPEELQKLVLKGKEPITCRPGELLPDEDFEAVRQHLNEQFGIEADMKQVMSYCMYPKVYENYLEAKLDNGEFLHMGSDVFFHGIREGETAEIALKEGKILVTKLVEIRKPDMEGFRELIFEVNGNRRTVKILDKAAKSVATVSSTIMAEEGNPNEVGANIPGTLMKLLVKEGDDVKEGDPIAVLEAMKMETNVLATATGKLAKFNVKEGQQVVAGELIATIE